MMHKLNKGGQCPKCDEPMERRTHTAQWRPKRGKPYYFAYWDWCGSCLHLQHYEVAKRDIRETKKVMRG